jgi:hypothetical protein
MHPFFKTVNWEAVLQKRITPPVNPVTLKFFTIDPDAPGHADESERNTSIENTHREHILEQPPPQPLNAQCPATDTGARGDADESRNSTSFKSAVDTIESGSSSSSFHSAVE